MLVYIKDGLYVEYVIGYEDYVGLVFEKLDIIIGVFVVCVGVIIYKLLK